VIGVLYGTIGFLLLTKVPLCPVSSVVHHPCPGGGLTRATLHAAHFDLAAAWSMHPFAFALSPLLLVAAVFATSSYLRDGDARLPKWFRQVFLRGGAILIVALVPFWIARFFGFHGGPVPVGP
jgi:hypothetical protein